MPIDYGSLMRPDLPAPATRWTGRATYNFVGGDNDAASLPVDDLRAAVDRALIREGKTLATYSLDSGPLGHRPLREYLTRKLKRYSQIDCNADDILLTGGSLQGMDLINQIFLSPGDTVIVEESNYGGVITRLNRLQVKPISIPVGADGMDVTALETALGKLAAANIRPKYIYTIPTVHNPTGTIMPEPARRRVLALSAEYGVPIFEDECYADLVWSGKRPPALKALDELGAVIHIGSFSKTVAPALRVGYVVADWEVLSRLLSVKADAGSGALEQMMLAEFCEAHFDRHLVKLKSALEAKLDALIEALERDFGAAAEFTRPPGGIFLWVKLDEAVDTTRLAVAAAKAGVALNPGREWSYGKDAGNWLRLCFANPSVETIHAGVARLAEVCHQEFSTPVRGANVTRSP